MFWRIVSIVTIAVTICVIGVPTNGASRSKADTKSNDVKISHFIKTSNKTSTELVKNYPAAGKLSFLHFFTPSVMLILLAIIIFLGTLTAYCAVLRSWERKRFIIKKDRSRSLLLDEESDLRDEDGHNRVGNTELREYVSPKSTHLTAPYRF